MEDSRSSEDMSLRPQMFLFGCELKADKKEFHFKGGDDENEHHLCLKTISLGPGAKDELNIVEAEGMSFEGKAIKVTLASLKLSVQPTVSLGGFEIQAPVTLRLKSGSGPLYIGGQHIVALEEDFESDEGEEEEDDDKEDDNETNRVAGKRAATALSAKLPQKKAKLSVKEEEDDEDEDDDDDDDDDEDDDDEDEEESPVKKAVQDSKPQKSSQNGKISKTSTPASTPKQKTPEKKAQEKKPQTPKTPKVPLTMEEVKAKMLTGIEKGVALPKLEPKFQNYVKHGFRVEDPKIIQELWKWRQSLKDGK